MLRSGFVQVVRARARSCLHIAFKHLPKPLGSSVHWKPYAQVFGNHSAQAGPVGVGFVHFQDVWLAWNRAFVEVLVTGRVTLG